MIVVCVPSDSPWSVGGNSNKNTFLKQLNIDINTLVNLYLNTNTILQKHLEIDIIFYKISRHKILVHKFIYCWIIFAKKKKKKNRYF